MSIRSPELYCFPGVELETLHLYEKRRCCGDIENEGAALLVLWLLFDINFYARKKNLREITFDDENLSKCILKLRNKVYFKNDLKTDSTLHLYRYHKKEKKRLYCSHSLSFM